MNYTTRIEQAITAVRKDMGCKTEFYSPAPCPKYWDSIQKRAEEFDVSGAKLDLIMQAKIK